MRAGGENCWIFVLPAVGNDLFRDDSSEISMASTRFSL